MGIAIIGGGFSGISVAAHLVYHGYASPIYLIEKSRSNGHGPAYSTPFPWHLLNVRAAQMGALAEDPEGFYHWLNDNKNRWREIDPYFKNLSFSGEDFVPRKIFGAYLSDLIKQMKEKSKAFQMINKEAVDIVKQASGQLDVIFQDSSTLQVDRVVLATGVQVIKQLPFAIEHERYIPNIWQCPPQIFKKHIEHTNKNSKVFIVGAGLTMIDMITTLENLNYQGTIVSLSHHGHLPSPQYDKHLPYIDPPSNLLEDQPLLQKFILFLKQLKDFEINGGNWRQFFDSIRPHASHLWQQLTLKDKKRFLRHLVSPWNKHRHRMPPESARLIDGLLNKKKLEIIAGSIISLKDQNNHIEVSFHIKNSQAIHTLNVDYIYNCTGPEFCPKKQPGTLFSNLLKKGWLIPDDLNLGIKSNQNNQVDGPLSEQLFVIGSLLFGDRFETTAVPEIRLQAQKITSSIM